MKKVLWFTGLSGAGKTTIADALAHELRAKGKTVEILDGDVVRTKLHKHLGFSEAGIKENNRLIAQLAREYKEKFDVVLVPIISPFTESRALARETIGEGFVEVYIAASHEARKTRDPKGLYKKVEAGEIKDFIGYGGVPYEAPEHPELTLDTDTGSVEESVKNILKFLNV